MIDTIILALFFAVWGVGILVLGWTAVDDWRKRDRWIELARQDHHCNLPSFHVGSGSTWRCGRCESVWKYGVNPMHGSYGWRKV